MSRQRSGEISLWSKSKRTELGQPPEAVIVAKEEGKRKRNHIMYLVVTEQLSIQRAADDMNHEDRKQNSDLFHFLTTAQPFP
jgi:hypothetical protein